MIRVTQALRTAQLQYPDRLASIYGDRRHSWAEFSDRVARIAGAFAGLGIEPGDRIAILAENSDSYLECFFAAPWCGAILVPVNTRLSPPEVSYVMNHSGAKLLVVDEAMASLWERTRPLVAKVPDEVRIEPGSGLDSLVGTSGPIADRSEGGVETASIFYTGGTTGRSKGVMLSHAAHILNSMAMWATLGLSGERLRYLHAAPMFHVADAEFVHAITLVGGTHVIIPRFEPAAALSAIEQHRITDCILVPTMVQKIVDAPERAQTDLSSLQRLYYGGAPMPEAVATRALAALPDLGLVQLYGQTESGPVLTLLTPDGHRSSQEQAVRKRSAGKPLLGTDIAIMDSDGNLLPVGEVGEIVARSGNLMSGYWDDPEETAKAFRGGWLHTGDGGYMDADGYLYVTDRLKDMIISGGENIYSIEVERAISLYPGVAQCAVIGIPHEQWGESVHAIIFPLDGAVIDTSALLDHCRGLIAGYKCPRSFEIRSEQLPLSGAGKILKRELRDEWMKRTQAAYRAGTGTA
ncbi:acyl-CoA synthetase [Sphingobium tyrosinilyticum]|uniref:Long-chain fatty acid--CoA ligase n=1 Tax=Sphingobium tyrosinilyticum TaxID=2715436 RepID=A0ABV9F2Z4_9SPHN